MTGCRVVAIVSMFNEADIIVQCISALNDEGVEAYVLDDGSTDGSADLVEPIIGHGVIALERLPSDGTFNLARILERKQALVNQIDAHWFINHDADEFREAPWLGIRLANAITLVDQAGYNAIDFALLDFWPSANSDAAGIMRAGSPSGDDDRPERDVRDAVTGFRQGQLFNTLQIRCWRKQPSVDVDLVSSGGHEARFQGRRVFPLRFLLRHYPVRSFEHAQRKIAQERLPRFTAAERERGWHIHYDGLDSSRDIIPSPSELRDYDAALLRVETAVDDLARSELELREAAERDALNRLDEEIKEYLRQALAANQALASNLSEFGTLIGNPHLSDRRLHGLRDAINQICSRLDATVRELESERSANASLRQHVNTLERRIDTLNQDVQRAGLQIRHIEEDRRGLRRYLSEARDEVEKRGRMIDDLRESWSWRLTRPLRAAIDLAVRRPDQETPHAAQGAAEPRPAASLSAPESPLEKRLLVSTAATADTASVERASSGVAFSLREVASMYAEPCSGATLAIVETIPTPDLDSGSFRLFEMLKILIEMNHEVVLLAEERHPQQTERHVAQLTELGVRVSVGDSVAAHLCAHGRRYRYVLLSRPEVACRHMLAVRAYAVHACVVYDTVDLHSLRLEREAAATGDPIAALAARSLASIERFDALFSDVTIAVTEDDRRGLLALAPEASIEVVPNIHPDVNTSIPGWNSRTGLMFIGGFWHRPNVDAVRFMVDEILPLIRAELPDVAFNIVGSNMPETIRSMDSPSVRCVGYVADPAKWFTGSRVFVAPLRYGAGMKGKIGQAMSLGLPVVTTSIGAEGMGLIDGQTAMLADSPREFASAVVALYTRESLWEQVSSEGVAHVSTNFSTATARRLLERVFPRRATAGSTRPAFEGQT